MESNDDLRFVDMIVNRKEADEIFEVAPKLALSSIKLLWQLYRAERQDVDTVGAQLSRRYLSDTATRIKKEANFYSHHSATPQDSPHYIETYSFINHPLRRRIATTIIEFLSSQPEPPTDRNTVNVS